MCVKSCCWNAIRFYLKSGEHFTRAASYCGGHASFETSPPFQSNTINKFYINCVTPPVTTRIMHDSHPLNDINRCVPTIGTLVLLYRTFIICMSLLCSAGPTGTFSGNLRNQRSIRMWYLLGMV